MVNNLGANSVISPKNKMNLIHSVTARICTLEKKLIGGGVRELPIFVNCCTLTAEVWSVNFEGGCP